MDEKETAAVRALEEGRKRFESQRGRTEDSNRTFGEGLVVSRFSSSPFPV
jgi:hypothetical protein